MPGPRSKKAKVSVKNKGSLNTKWLNNAMKSIGAASADTFKSIAPNISSTGSAVSETLKTARRTVKGTSARRIGKLLSENRYVQLAQGAVNQSINDIKTGNLYNQNRAAEKYAGDLGLDDFDDGWDSDDYGDGEASVTFNYIDEGDDNGGSNASVMISDAINQSSQAQLKASKATIDAMIGVSSASISVVQQGFYETNEKLDAISSTLDAILQYHEENTTNYYEKAIAAFERIGSSVTDDNPLETNNPLDIFASSRGGLNNNHYKEYVKGNIKKAIDESPVGMLLPWLKDEDTLNMMLADPVGGLTKGLIGGMIPKVVEGTLKEVEKTFTDFIPNMLVRASSWANDRNSTPFKKLIGKIFGVDIKTITNMRNTEVTKDAATFDNVTRNAIVEVLPKYARESTSYLRQIAMHVTHKKDDKLLSEAEIFDPLTNSYKKKDELMKTFTDGFSEAIKNSFDNSEFGKVLNSISGNLKEKDKKKYEDTLEQFFTELANSDGLDVKEYDVKNKDSRIHEVLDRVNGGRGKKILEQALQYMYDNEIGIGNAAMAQLTAKRAWNERVDDINQNYDRYNTINIGVNDQTNFLKMMEEAQGNKAAFALDKAAEEQKKKEEEQAAKSFRPPKFKNDKALVENSIQDWLETEKYRENRDLKGGMIGDRLFSDQLKDGFAQMGGHAKSGMYMIMKGDSSGALAEFSSIFTDQLKTMWNGVNEHFFKPLGEKLFGKDENGSAQGLFANTRNSLNDTYKELIQRINGKDYKDSNGEVHSLKDGEEPLTTKAFNIFKDVKESITYRLFGDEETRKERKEKGKGAINTFTESIRMGLQGWKEAIFGDSDNPEEQAKIDKETIKEGIMKNLPDAIIGSGGGALFGALSGGSLLGTLIGGPIGGAAIGFAGSFLMKSEKFKDYIFGPEIENPDGTKKRIGGLISEKTQNFFKSNKKTIIGGAAIGAVKSMIFPSSAGLLTGIVGGPIAGAAIGAGWGLLKNSEMFQKFLYGDEETGRRGVIQSFKDLFKGGKSGNGNDENKTTAMKALGMGAVGAGGFALTSALVGKMGLMGALVTPGGPLGGAIIGAAVGIAASGNKFSKWLFGEKDEETGKRKGGMIQKFGNYMHTEILAPMRSKALDLVEDIKTTIQFDIIENIRLPFVAVADTMKKKLSHAKEFLSEKIDHIASNVIQHLVKPFGKVVDKFVVQPVKKVVSTVTTVAYNVGKALITLPFKMLGKAAKFSKTLAVKAVKKITGGILGAAWKTAGFIGSVAKGAFGKVFGVFDGFFKGIKKIRQNKKDKKERKGKTSLSGKFSRLAAKLTNDDWLKDYYTSKADRADQIAKNKQNREARRTLDWNRRQMAKALGYDVKYFTEENYEAAKRAAKEKGMKIEWRGGSKKEFEDDPAEKRKELLKQSTAKFAREGMESEDIDIRQLSEAHRTNDLLEEIARQQGISIERAEELNKELAEERKRDAELAGFDYNEETGELTPKEEKSFKERMKDNIDSYTTKIEEAGGLKSYLGKKLSDTFSIKKGYEGSELQGTVNSGREKVKSIFSKFGKTRAKGGPADKDDPLLVGDGGPDLSAAEIFVPKSKGKILSQKDDGIKVTLTSITGSVVDTLKDIMKNPFGNKKKKGKKNKNSNDSNDNSSDDTEGESDELDAFGFPKELVDYYAEKAADKKKKEDSRSILEIWRDELGDEGVGSFKNLQKAKAKEEEKAKQEEYQDSIKSTLGEIRDKNEGHFNIWNKIFSKKGILTVGVLAFAGLLIKNWDSFKSAISGIAQFTSWWNKNHNGTDGKTTTELIEDEVSDAKEVGSALKEGKIATAASKFVLDDGKYDANSGGRVSLLAQTGNKALRAGSKIVNTTVKAGKTAVNAGKSAVNGAKTIAGRLSGKAAQEGAESVVQNTAKNVATDSLSVWGEALAENAGETVVQNVAKESAEATVEKGAKTGASKVISLVKTAFESIVAKVAEKAPNVANSKLLSSIKSLMTKMGDVVKSKWTKISEKITKVTASKGTADAVTLGLDKVVFVTVGAINGVSGTAKLFQVDKDKVDGWMRIISAAFGAIVTGTIVGSIIDIISGLIAEVLGFDFLNAIACAIYSVLAGEDKTNDLNEAKQEFQQKYSQYKEDTISEQYETQKAAGIIDSSVTLEDFQEGVSNGTYSVDIQSFQDYNADQHQSIGYKIGKGLSKGWRGVKSFFGGKTSYTDENGQVYADNGDGTYTIYDENGKKIGTVDKDAVDVSGMESSTKGGVKSLVNTLSKPYKVMGKAITGAASTIGSSVASVFKNVTSKVSNLGDETKEFASRLMEYTDTSKSMDDFDKETMGDEDDATSKILSPIIRWVVKFYVNFRRGISSVADFFTEKLDKAKEFADNASSSISGFFSNMVSSASSLIGGSGNGPKSKKIGGRGEEPESANGFSYYSQEDPRWKDNSYIAGTDDGATMGDSGCGPTAMAMVATQAAQGKSISPTQMANLASENGFRDETGTNEQFIAYAGDNLGMSHTDVTNPSSDFIRESVNSGNPVILNGVSDNNSAFTPEGHYVVAVGTDDNGNVMVNDPRGSSYNTSYTPEELSSNTRKAWSFGGSGFGKRRNTRRKIGGRGVSGDWMSIVKDIKTLIANQHPAYDQSSSIKITYKGTEMTVRNDCSGYVGACLQAYGAIPAGTNVTSLSLLSSSAISSGFTYGGWTGWDNLKQGDIISRNGHVEIFDRNVGNSHYVYSNGCTKDIASSTSTVSDNGNYTVVWRPGNAGTGAEVSATVDTSSSSDTTSTTSSSSSSSGGLTSILSKLGSIFTQTATKAWNGILTNNWDYNYSYDDDDSSSSDSSSSDSSLVSSSGGHIVSANVDGSTTAEKLYKFLRQNGVTAAGASGVLGNLFAESGLKTNNLQDSYNTKLGMSDEAYTSAVDNGTYSNFANDSAGYGLAQWTSSNRKKGLLDLAKSTGKSISDPDVHITHLWNELNSSYKNSVLSTLMSTDSVKEASDVVLHKFESPADQSAAVENKRASYANGYYDMYANESTDSTDDSTDAATVSSTNSSTNTSSTSKRAGSTTTSATVSTSNGSRRAKGTSTSGYGHGPKHRTQMMFGGRGFVDDDVAVSSAQQDLYDLTSNLTNKNSSTQTTVSTETLEKLLSTAIKVLQSIDTNTSKIDSLQNTQVSSDNYGGNVIVNKTTNNTGNTLDLLEASKNASGSSTNATLAKKIARGGI